MSLYTVTTKMMSSIYLFRHTITGISISFHGIAENLFIRSIYENLMFCCNGLLHTISLTFFTKNIILYFGVYQKEKPPQKRAFLPRLIEVGASCPGVLMKTIEGITKLNLSMSFQTLNVLHQIGLSRHELCTFGTNSWKSAALYLYIGMAMHSLSL